GLCQNEDSAELARPRRASLRRPAKHLYLDLAFCSDSGGARPSFGRHGMVAGRHCDYRSSPCGLVALPRLVGSEFTLSQRAAVNPIGLISCRPHRFDKTIDHYVVLERHAKFASESAFESFIHHFENERFGYPSTTIFFDHAEGDEPACS